jgi:hypothetical protein
MFVKHREPLQQSLPCREFADKSNYVNRVGSNCNTSILCIVKEWPSGGDEWQLMRLSKDVIDSGCKNHHTRLAQRYCHCYCSVRTSSQWQKRFWSWRESQYTELWKVQHAVNRDIPLEVISNTGKIKLVLNDVELYDSAYYYGTNKEPIVHNQWVLPSTLHGRTSLWIWIWM